MPPVCIAAFLRAFPIEPRQVGARRRLDAGGLRQPRQKLLIGFARVAPHDAPQSRVGLERGGIDPDRLSLDRFAVARTCRIREHRAVGLQVDQPTSPRDRRVLGRCFVQAKTQEPAQRGESAVRHAMPRSESMPSK